MDIQEPIDYWKLFTDLMQRRQKLIQQRDEADIELVKMKQLIASVYALLPLNKQVANQQAIEEMETESAGLQDAIKLVFSAYADKWMTVSDVRDRLNEIGFDFRQYKANPLASIGTTLKRITQSGYIEASIPSPDGTTRYKRKSLTYAEALGTTIGVLGLGARYPRIGQDPKQDSAYDSGMRGNEKPRKTIGRRMAEKD